MKSLMLLFLLIFTHTGFAQRNMQIADNVVVMAAKGAKVSMFSKQVDLPDGDQKLVVKFDSPINPDSINQGKGRITSAFYLLAFHYTDSAPLMLAAGNVSNEREAKSEALSPHFTLMAGNRAVPFTLEKIDKEGVTLFTDFNAWLNSKRGEDVSSPAQNRDETEKVQRAFIGLSDKQKVIFMQWLLTYKEESM